MSEPTSEREGAITLDERVASVTSVEVV
jgi:hypothetical protein